MDRQIRPQGWKPDEEYYYHTLREAEAHKWLFQDDNSDLYEAIEIVSYPIYGGKSRMCVLPSEPP